MQMGSRLLSGPLEYLDRIKISPSLSRGVDAVKLREDVVAADGGRTQGSPLQMVNSTL